jgi:DNA modification methylase
MQTESLEFLKTTDLIPYARNSRTHTEEQLSQIAGSIQEFGFTNPVLIDERNGIIAGHGRVLAAIKLKFDEVPCRRLTHLSEAQRRAYVIADNRLALNAGWNDEMLANELGDLEADDFDLGLLGFDADELSTLLGYDDEPAGDGITEDEVPEPPVDPITQPGDVWILGRHRLVCGDSTKVEDVRKALTGKNPFMMVTDPPYGVDYDPKWRLDVGLNKEHQTRAEGKVTNDNQASWKEAWDLFPGVVAYVWHGALHSTTVALDLIASKFQLRAQIIWVKPSLVIGRGAYHWRHEPCWYGSRGTAKWTGDRKQSTAWEIQNMHRTQGNVDDGKTIHGTQKPVECMARPIRNHGDEHDAVYDPFLGSGTTLIAAEQLKRECYGLEIDPIYCDVIVKRWENLTGEKATRE